MNHRSALILSFFVLSSACDSAECERLSDCDPGTVCVDGQCVGGDMPVGPRPSVPRDAGTTDAAPADMGAGPDAGAASTDASAPVQGESIPSTVVLEWTEGAEGAWIQATTTSYANARFVSEEEEWSNAEGTVCTWTRRQLVAGEIEPLERVDFDFEVINDIGLSPIRVSPTGPVTRLDTVPMLFDDFRFFSVSRVLSEELPEESDSPELALAPAPAALEQLELPMAGTSSVSLRWAPIVEADEVRLSVTTGDAYVDRLDCTALPASGRLDVPSEVVARWRAQADDPTRPWRLTVETRSAGELVEASGSSIDVEFVLAREVFLRIEP